METKCHNILNIIIIIKNKESSKRLAKMTVEAYESLFDHSKKTDRIIGQYLTGIPYFKDCLHHIFKLQIKSVINKLVIKPKHPSIVYLAKDI